MSLFKIPNKLKRTRCYLIGPMQYMNGRGWRQSITPHLREMGIIVLDPYNKPFIVDVEEGEQIRDNLNKMMENGEYDKVARIAKNIRSYDLSMVDKSDFVIHHVSPTVPTFGSMEEMTTAVRMKRPAFVFVDGGKKKCPLWVMGMIPHEYIYDSVEDVVKTLQGINYGTIPIDNDRWRLFKEEYR